MFRFPRYHSYLLRFWQEDSIANSWRFMLENPHSGETKAFTSYTELMSFLEVEMARESDTKGYIP